MAKKSTTAVKKSKTTIVDLGIPDKEAAAAMAPAVVKKPKQQKQQKKKKPAKVVHPKATLTFRRNVLPGLLGISLSLGLLGLLNAPWVEAQYAYHFPKPIPASSYAVTPTTTDPNAPAHIYIPNINVSAPLVTDVKTYDAPSVQLGLRRGPVQYGASVNPGEKGNIVIVGHSSGQLWAPGNYKFVFTLLDKMAINDRILIDFKGKRYIYRVSGSKIVPPTDTSVLQQTDAPQLTLITCTPVGTSKNRRVITARQVSPNPDTAVAVDTSKLAAPAAIPN